MADRITSKKRKGGWGIYLDGRLISTATTVEARQVHMQNLAKADREATE